MIEWNGKNHPHFIAICLSSHPTVFSGIDALGGGGGDGNVMLS